MFYNNNLSGQRVDPHEGLRPARAPQCSTSRPPAPVSDREHIARWERRIQGRVECRQKFKNVSISCARRNMQHVLRCIRDLKSREEYISGNVASMSEEEWSEAFREVDARRRELDRVSCGVDDEFLRGVQRALARRATRRVRLRATRRRAAALRAEGERRIECDLQRQLRELLQEQQVERDKLSADVFLREVLRRKHDARRCVDKLEALATLRRARRQSATGRGQHTSQTEADVFNTNIQKLVVMWRDKLASYEREEAELQRRLAPAAAPDHACDATRAWRTAMFGDENADPQRDFHGDMSKFIAVRCAWDAFLHSEGTALPLGWLLPSPLRTHTRTQ